MKNRYFSFFLTILLLVLQAFAAPHDPIVIDIPATVMDSPESLAGAWGNCLGNDQGSFPQYCNWIIATGSNDYSDYMVFEDREECSSFGGSAEKKVMILEFNIGVIPDTANISDISLFLDVDSISSTTAEDPSIQCSDMLATTTRPSERALGVTNLTDALGGNLGDKDYFYGSIVHGVGTHSVHLNSDGMTDFENQLDDDWFALGLSICDFMVENGTAVVDLADNNYAHYLRVTYYLPYEITVQTEFADGQVVIDDTLRDSPYSAPWVEDDIHEIGVDSVQTPGLGVKYLYRYWSDGGDRFHNVHVTPDTILYTAYFDTLYQLLVESPYGTYGPVDPDSVWFEPREWATISIEPETVFVGGDSLERHVFQGWDGVGSGSYTGTLMEANVRMNGPVTEYAVWDTAYWLDLEYAGLGSATIPQTGEGWAFTGDSVWVATPESVEVDSAWYFFTYWTDGAGHLRDSTSASTWYVNPDMPRTFTAHYQVDPNLSVFPDSLRIVSPGHNVLIPIILDADVSYPVDSFRMTIHYNDAKLNYVDLVNSSVIWSELTPTTGTSQITVFGDAPGTYMSADPLDTLFYVRMLATYSAADFDTITIDDFRYAFIGAETYPGYVQFVPEDLSITVTTDYGGDSVWIDGTPYPAPYSDTWVGAATRNIGADTLNPLGVAQMARFIGWSDSGARFHDVNPLSDSTFIALFDTLLYLDVVSDYGTPSGSGWYDRGEEPGFSVTPEIVTSGASRHVFDGWIGVGDDSYTGGDNPATCTMQTPITETAQWQLQYWLELDYTDCGAAVPTLTGEGWWNDGASVPISADSVVDDGGTSYYFAWWSGGNVDDRFSHSTNANIGGVDTITAVYADVPFSFALEVPESVYAVVGEYIYIPVSLDIPTSTELEDIGFHLYYNNDCLDYTSISDGSLIWSSLAASNLSSGSDGHIYVTAGSGTALSCDPHDTLCIIELLVTDNIIERDTFIAGNPDYDIERALPDSGEIIFQQEIDVTITTSPLLGNVRVDGLSYAAPYEISWLAGDDHFVGVDSIQYPEYGVQMLFTNWSDLGDRVHSVSPVSDSIFTANFAKKYLIEVISDFGTPAGTGWYEEGSEAVFSVTPESLHAGGSYYLFDSWVGSGDGSYTGTSNPSTATVNEHITETAQWNSYHYLDLYYSSIPTDPGLIGQGWYENSSIASIEATDSFEVAGTWYYFVYWEGLSGYGDPLANPTDVEMWEPLSVTAVYSETPANFSIGVPPVTFASSESYCMVPVIYHGSEIDFDTIGFNLILDDTKAGLTDLLPADFEWGSYDLSGTSTDRVIYCDHDGEFTVHDGDTLVNLMFYVYDVSGDITLDLHTPAYDLSDGVAIDGQIRVPDTANVIVRTDYGGMIFVDGEELPSPVETCWSIGSEHQITAKEWELVATGHRKYFRNWSDGQPRSHYVEIFRDSVFQANYQDYYYLSVHTGWGVSYGADWYERGDYREFSVAPEIVVSGDDRYLFTGWEGHGTGSYTGSNNPAYVTMNAHIRQIAQWQIQHYLALACEGCGDNEPELTGAGWHDLGSWASISAQHQVFDLARAVDPYSFHHWTGGVFADSTNPTTTVRVDSGMIVTAIYSNASISTNDTIWVALGDTAKISVRANATDATDLDTLSISITFSEDYLQYIDIDESDVAWDILNVTQVDLSGELARLDICAVKNIPHVVDGVSELFKCNMLTLAEGEESPLFNIDAVHSADFDGFDFNGVIIISDVANVTLTSAIADSFIFNGSTYLEGSEIPVAVGSPNRVIAYDFSDITADNRWRFSHWDDSPNRIREIRAHSDTTLNANYVNQYYIDAISVHGSLIGEGWYDIDDSAFCAVLEDSINVGDSIIYLFDQWAGDYTGISNPCTLVVDAAKTITASWDTLYKVLVQSDYGTAITEGWVQTGDSSLVQITPTEVAFGATRYSFREWNGTGIGSYSGTEDSIWIHPESPVHEKAIWDLQYFVTVISDGYGVVHGGGWYNDGDTAWFSLEDSLDDSTATIRFIFDGWNGEGDDSYTGGELENYCTVLGPITQTATWIRQNYLTVDSGGHSTAYGEGWYTQYDSAEFRIEPDSVMVDRDVAWQFDGWIGTGVGSYSGIDNPADCFMGEPVIEEAIWNLKYYLEIEDSGALGLPEFEGEGWQPVDEWVSIAAPPIVISGSSRLSFLRWAGAEFDDSLSNSTQVFMDTSLTITAHYSNFEVSTPGTLLVAAGDTIEVPIILHYPYLYELFNIQFDMFFPASLLEFIGGYEVPSLDWTSFWSTLISPGRVNTYGNRSPIWVDPPETLCILKFRALGTSGALDTVTLGGFGGNISNATNTPGLLMISAPIEVVIQADYAGDNSSVIVDGTQYESPYVANWMSSECHTIRAINDFTEGGTRAAWSHWSDGLAQSHTICPAEDDTFTAYYNVEHRLNVESLIGSAWGSGWYPEDDTVGFGVIPDSVRIGNEEHVFRNWVGTGTESYSGPNNPAICVMDGPIQESAQFDTRYKLTVDGVRSPSTGSGWYFEGAIANFSVINTTVDSAEGIRWAFDGWVGPYSGYDNPASWTVAGDATETAQWRLEYLLTIVSERGEYIGEGWYTAGDSAEISIDEFVDSTAGIRWAFDGWDGGASGYIGHLNPVKVHMTAPLTEVVSWKKQYRLDIASDWATTYGSGWYDEGDSAFYHVEPETVTFGSNRKIFKNWFGHHYDAHNPAYTIMIEPQTQTANWTDQYYLSVDGGPSASTGEGWYDSGQNATFSVANTFIELEGVRDQFIGWRGLGTASYTGTGNPAGCCMLSAVEEIAQFDTFFYVDIVSEHGTVFGDGYTEAGESSLIGVTPDSIVNHGVLYLFEQWLGEGPGSYTGTFNPRTVYPDSAIEQIAVWDTSFRLIMQAIGCGSADPGLNGAGFVRGWTEIAAENPVYDGSDRYHLAMWIGATFEDEYSSETRVMIDSPDTAVAVYTAFEISPIDTSRESAGNYVEIPIIVYDTAGVIPMDSIGFDLRYDDDLLNFDQIVEHTDFDWNMAFGVDLSARDMSGHVQVRAYNPTEFNFESGDTLLYLRMLVATGGPSITALHIENRVMDVSTAGSIDGWFLRNDEVNVVVENHLIGDSVYVDGTAYLSPYSDTWVPGEVHHIEAKENIAISEGSRYHFDFWNGGGTRDRYVWVSSDSTFIAVFDEQQKFTVFNSGGDSPYPAVGGHWYDTGTEINAYVHNPDPESHYHCYGYNGTGDLFSGGSEDSVTFNITQPTSIHWLWLEQIYLLVNGGIGDSYPSPGTTWFAPGTTIAIWSDDTFYLDPDSAIYCPGWTGTGSVPSTGDSNNLEFTINENSSIDWLTQVLYRLTLAADACGSGYPDILELDGFFTAGSNVPIVTSNSVSDAPVEYFFDSWSSLPEGAVFSDDSDTSTTISMDAPFTAVANYKQGVRLHLIKNPEEGFGGFWVDGHYYGDGAEAMVWKPKCWTGTIASTELDTADGNDSLWSFNSWSDDGDISHVIGPVCDDISLTAFMDKRYRVRIQKDPLTDEFGSMRIDGSVITGSSSADTTVWWLEGSNHDIEASLYDNDTPDKRFAWNSWSDLGARDHRVGPVDAPDSLVAFYRRQYTIVVQKDPAQDAGWIRFDSEYFEDVSQVEKWYNSGASAEIEVSTLDGHVDTLWTFQNWLAGGTSPTMTCDPVDTPHVYTAEYLEEIVVLDFSVDHTEWRVGDVNISQTRTMLPAEMIQISNDGSNNLVMGIEIIDPGSWESGYGSGLDKFALKGRFNDSSTAPTSWSLTNDIVLEELHWADDVRFGPGGLNVEISTTENLWMSFTSPSQSELYGANTIIITIYGHIVLP